MCASGKKDQHRRCLGHISLFPLYTSPDTYRQKTYNYATAHTNTIRRPWVYACDDFSVFVLLWLQMDTDFFEMFHFIGVCTMDAFFCKLRRTLVSIPIGQSIGIHGKGHCTLASFHKGIIHWHPWPRASYIGIHSQGHSPLASMAKGIVHWHPWPRGIVPIHSGQESHDIKTASPMTLRPWAPWH